MDEIRIEKRTWTHAPRAGQTDYRGQERFVLLVDGLVEDHFATQDEADAAAVSADVLEDGE